MRLTLPLTQNQTQPRKNHEIRGDLLPIRLLVVKLLPSLNFGYFLILSPHRTFRKRDRVAVGKFIVRVDEFQQEIRRVIRGKQEKNMHGCGAVWRSHDQASWWMFDRSWPKLKSSHGWNNQELRLRVYNFYHTLNELSRKPMLKICHHGKRLSPRIRSHLQTQIKILQLLLDWCCHEEHGYWAHKWGSRKLFCGK